MLLSTLSTGARRAGVSVEVAMLESLIRFLTARAAFRRRLANVAHAARPSLPAPVTA